MQLQEFPQGDKPKQQPQSAHNHFMYIPIKIDPNNPRESLLQLQMLPPTYEDLARYCDELAKVRDKVDGKFYRAAIRFLLPYLVSVRAISDANVGYAPADGKYGPVSYSQQQDANEKYTTETYGVYTYMKEDCFTYFRDLYRLYAVESRRRKLDLSGVSEIENSFMPIFGVEAKREKIDLSNVGTLHLQVSDIIMVSLSPNNTGKNHWGTIVFDNGELKVSHRSGNLIRMDTLDDFFRNMGGTVDKNGKLKSDKYMEIVRWGNSHYAEHFKVKVDHEISMKERKYNLHFGPIKVEGAEPESFTGK